jgi:hypothetical protein
MEKDPKLVLIRTLIDFVNRIPDNFADTKISFVAGYRSAGTDAGGWAIHERTKSFGVRIEYIDPATKGDEVFRDDLLGSIPFTVDEAMQQCRLLARDIRDHVDIGPAPGDKDYNEDDDELLKLCIARFKERGL